MTKILLIDDDTMVYDLTRRVLQSTDYELIWATDGIDALKKLSEMAELPDLVLCDIMMPRMDGHKTLGAIRDDPRLKDLRVVMLTAHSQVDNLRKAQEHGAVGYITKPFRVRGLLAEINRYLSLEDEDL
jgi:CheY-like chemotaxis protein